MVEGDKESMCKKERIRERKKERMKGNKIKKQIPIGDEWKNERERERNNLRNGST